MAKILLVEDDNNLREIYGARLGAEGYDIVSAADGEEALAIAVKEKPDLIISDVMMPKVSGFDMLDILRNAPETKNTKIIMMTALSQAEDKERADKLGADLYLVKSQVTLEDVAASVKKILGGDSGEEAQPDSSGTSAPQSPQTSAPPQPSEEPPAPANPAPEPPQSSEPPTPAPAPVAPAEPPASPPDNPAPPQSQTPPAPAPSSAPAQPPQQPTRDNQSAQPPAEPPQQPVQDSQPVQPPTEPPAEKPASEPKKIEVVLPEDNKPAEEPAPAPAEQAQPAPPSAPEPGTPSIGPTLEEALAQEEQSDPDQSKEQGIDDSASSQPAPAGNAPSTVVKPQKPVSEEELENTDDDRPKLASKDKKVIQPINDPTQKPDINELVAQEQAKDNLGTSYTGQKPENPDDFSKISL
ncbi:MAG TPA: response regulator [Candidatus Saccharimonadales bacterium]|nr:response regulator [Candidatus Saccharimonadales bacterium]